MAIEVFKRKENKYKIDAPTYEALLHRLAEYMDFDKFNRGGEPYSICNIYYDSDDSSMIRNSLSKPKYKEKLRIRSYGVPNMDDSVYLEIKKKYRGEVSKRRCSMDLQTAYKFLDRANAADAADIENIVPHDDATNGINDTSGLMSDASQRSQGSQASQGSQRLQYIEASSNQQVAKEIAYLLDTQKNLHPKVYISYDRMAFFDRDKTSDLRISFDSNIRARRTDVRLESGSYGKKILPDDMYLMEIKCTGNMPLWLTKLLSEYEIRPSSFSKYGTEYMQYLDHAFTGDRSSWKNVSDTDYTKGANSPLGMRFTENSRFQEGMTFEKEMTPLNRAITSDLGAMDVQKVLEELDDDCA
ncbi:MAG: polyphosphate polymerase domain-containing protein [Clostridiales Family XIII bacterium]|jgi:hypothetical protein|nr:polyphosphate polymerase domain-containing protein [Clostridiales Family XIII bacterium]